MTHNNVRLVDWNETKLPSFKFRKIKLKKISFQSVYENWRNFRLSLYKKALENRQENLLNMGFKANQLSDAVSLERSEKKVLRKTKAIAKLESKIKFLETGIYATEEFVNNRAIKLKNSMMQSLVYNKNSVYQVPTEVKETFFEEEKSNVEPELVPNQESSEEQAVEHNEQTPVPTITETETETNNTSTEVAVENETQDIPVEREENVTDEKEDETSQTVITEQPSEGETEIETGTREKLEESTIVTNDEIADAIMAEMEKIKISTNESSSAKVNKFVEEDGTYRLKREDIEEDFRITNINTNEQTETMQSPEINTPPFNDEVQQSMEMTDTDADESVVYNEQEESVVEENAIPSEEETQRTSDLTTNLSALLEKVRVLSEKRERLAAEKTQADEEALETDRTYAEKINKLATYAEFLENDCAVTERETSETKATTMARQAEINAIEMMLEQSDMSKGTRRM